MHYVILLLWKGESKQNEEEFFIGPNEQKETTNIESMWEDSIRSMC